MEIDPNERLDLAVCGGTVVTATDTMRCDIGIHEGRIVQLANGLAKRAEQVINVEGKLVLPGGVDAHCHLDQQSPSGLRHADDFFSGTRSAAGGGTTTIIPFANQKKGATLRSIVEDYRLRALNRAVVDYAFHIIVSDPNDQVIGQELPSLIGEGYTSFKVFMTYDALRITDLQMLTLLSLASREGALLMVHAENHDCIEWLTDALKSAGKTEPKFHGVAHSAVGETEATFRAISLAEVSGASLMVVHVSSARALEEIERAQARGLRVFAETCPQYLVLTQDNLCNCGFEGAKFVCSPPPRSVSDQRALWRGLASGSLHIFSSDHAPYRYEGATGKKSGGEHVPFDRIVNGVPGLETRLPILFSEGVQKGRIDIQQFVALTATNPARLYGLYPRKGTIAIGSDADLAVWDPGLEVEIKHEILHDAMDYTPYEGMKVRGWPMITISRGEVVCRNGEVTSSAGRGHFLLDDRIVTRGAGKFRNRLSPSGGQYYST
ncbi:dihydropyrimidinase [Mesorhizobium sp.]|uniref:dihydropyrimidinase n=1 Tax=Mesorhizobium sp. TaxID=1871066 RepID=UPI000FE5F2A1|nr:dihydropyrimidinase [Mesorhizobium sp.]RWI87929.1 MAG: dihydropyrimidinase [Mesorhizobium sp.]